MTTPIAFTKATKKQAKLRLALIGPSGAGKTYTALAIAAGLGKKIAVVDTEAGSAELYSDLFAFDVLKLDSFHPQNYIDAIAAAGEAGYDTVILDSLSHAWTGKDGELELVDRATVAARSTNKFTNGWREVSPLHNSLIDSLIRAPLHVIATMRTKTEYVVEKDERTGKSAPRKVGLAPIQRNGLEYEFTVVADLDLDHNFIVSKTRCNLLDGVIVNKAGADIAATLNNWLEDGEVIPMPTAADKNKLKVILASLTELDAGTDWHDVAERAAKRDHGHGVGALTKPELSQITGSFQEHLQKLLAEKNGDAQVTLEEAAVSA